MPDSQTIRLARVLRYCKSSVNPLQTFNQIVLRRPPYWWAQREICRALWDPEVTTVVVPAGHSVGKSFMAAGAVLGWLTMWKDSLVVTTSPSNAQLSGVLWKEIRKARGGSPLIRTAGRITSVPNKLDHDDGWMAIGYSTNKAERLQGFHSSGGPLLTVVDEASGITDPEMWATLKSLKPRKTLLISNPLHAHGYFYDICRRAEDDPAVRLIRISSLDSPDIEIEESTRGLADAHWLREMIADYGADSQTFRVRVKALFPDSSEDALAPSAWLDLAEKAAHVPGGRRRLAIDVSEGNGGDDAVIIVRDENGVMHWEANNRLTFEAQASRVALLCQRFYIAPEDVTYDAGGAGHDFANRLEQAGIVGARGYKGGRDSKSPRYDKLRSACYWRFRRRLDPNWRDDLQRPQPQFYIPADLMKFLRFQLREITYKTIGEGGKTIAVRPGVDVRAALRRSPDHADALAQSFLSAD
jgi:hypothetical protein